MGSSSGLLLGHSASDCQCGAPEVKSSCVRTEFPFSQLCVPLWGRIFSWAGPRCSEINRLFLLQPPLQGQVV